MSGKLHELLAVEEDLKGMAKRIGGETEITFRNKQDHFVEKIVECAPFEESKETIVEGHTPMVETVQGKLDYCATALGKYFDALVQKESTNTVAKADITLDNGEVIAKDMPATALLGLERELTKVHAIYSVLPTLEPTAVWEKDTDLGTGISTTRISKVRTKKVNEPLVLAPATDRHPAQVQMTTKDVEWAKLNTTIHSSKITPARKSLLISRVDELKRAVKKARMRANTVEHHTIKVGETLFNYINA